MSTTAGASATNERAAALAGLAPDTPEIVIDLDIVRANIDRAAAVARELGVAVRPHTRTHKLPQIAQMQVEAGAIGVQVAKLGEAEVMADAGIDDILIGYPIVGERKLSRLAELAERISVSVTRELRSGCSRRACAASFTTMEVIPIRGVAPCSLSLARNSTSGFTSSSSTEVSCADVWRLDTMRLAIVPRRPRRGIDRRTVNGAPPAGGAVSGCDERASAHAVTSRSVMRPPDPDPVISRA